MFLRLDKTFHNRVKFKQILNDLDRLSANADWYEML